MCETGNYMWPKDWAKLRCDFIDTFDMSIVDFYDPLMSWVFGKFQIDIIKFDNRLHSKFGEYENNGLSMKDVIIKEYGKFGLTLIEQLI